MFGKGSILTVYKKGSDSEQKRNRITTGIFGTNTFVYIGVCICDILKIKQKNRIILPWLRYMKSRRTKRVSCNGVSLSG